MERRGLLSRLAFLPLFAGAAATSAEEPKSELQLAGTIAAVIAGFRMARPSEAHSWEQRWRWNCSVGAVGYMLGQAHDWKQEHYDNFHRDCGGKFEL